ncbi:MAG: hypothetical protein EZS28_039529 [Streblomastix strix]|uniref:Uncharacterized protein n=1 Tax=Streblomastix strix TaxID=222440 RepID=A0A5J4U3I4_9EUKA|nr:MAG: hypothetical protein EZS28_039529 [Streblomastix strix]
MYQRIQSKIEGNDGGEQFCKITVNSSYGSDDMNQEHFSDIKLCDIHETFRKHLNGRFKSDRKLGDNLYVVEFEQQKFNCKTCLQVAFAVLDCAKYWFMNFYYNFLTLMIDMNRVHLIYCDTTDSMMLAVAGDPKQNYKQGFSAVIKDKEFYDKNFYKFFPKPKLIITKESQPILDKIEQLDERKLKIKELQTENEKKPLGVAYEHCGSTLITLAPKNYWLRQEFDKKDPIVVKLKGMSLKLNPQINKDAYENNIKNGKIVKGKNTSLRQHQERNSDDEVFSKMSRINTTKNGITGVHAKMIVLENQCCCPYIDGISADKYKIQYKMLMSPD